MLDEPGCPVAHNALCTLPCLPCPGPAHPSGLRSLLPGTCQTSHVCALFNQRMQVAPVHPPICAFIASDLCCCRVFLSDTAHPEQPCCGRPPLQIYPSSGGQKLFTYGRGDDASYWAVTDFLIEGYVSAGRRSAAAPLAPGMVESRAFVQYSQTL